MALGMIWLVHLEFFLARRGLLLAPDLENEVVEDIKVLRSHACHPLIDLLEIDILDDSEDEIARRIWPCK